MGNTCFAPESPGKEYEFNPGAPESSDANGEAERLTELQGAEVVVLSGSKKEGCVLERGNLEVFMLRPSSKADTGGKYRITKQALVSSSYKHHKDEVTHSLLPNTVVDVLEVKYSQEDKRVRARIQEPEGWISLMNTQNSSRWAEKLEVVVLFVGESFEAAATASEGESRGFYYPLMLETPVLLDYDTPLLTLTAGDGDAFAIRLPKSTADAKLEELIESLQYYCDFRVEKAKDIADYIEASAGGVASVVGIAARGLSKALKKTGAATRNNMTQREDVKVNAGTKAALAGTQVATRTTVKVAGTVVEGLLNTAMYIGKEVGKDVGPEVKTPAKESKTVKAGKAAIMGSLTVFDALLKASDQLAGDAADETAAIAGKRYGTDVAEVTRKGLAVGGDVLEIKDMVGKKAVGKLAAKGAMYTAQGMVAGAVEKGQSSGSVQAGKSSG
mmetsp:Transcript_62721/g.176889  ORF Transcript_62721/g.176889 Transcript_62721/m.176889 type:complete len:444 (+) Transcript_62721:94-1425(+)